MKRPDRGDNETNVPTENIELSGKMLAGSDAFAQNDARTSEKIDTPVARGGSRGVPDGFTYFVRDGDAIKIGFSDRPKKRIKSLATGSPRELEVLAVVPASVADEFNTHQKFAHLRIRGEWFRSDPELLDFIEEVKKFVDQEWLAPEPPRAAKPIRIPKPVNPWRKLRGQLIVRRRGETNPAIFNRIDNLVSNIDHLNNDTGGPDLKIIMQRTMRELAALSRS